MSTPTNTEVGLRSSSPVLRIQASKGWVSLRIAELWAYRELLYFLAWRDVKVRYKQTLLGALWAILQPLLTMMIFTLVFSRIAKIPSDGIPYPLFAFSGLVPWTFFAAGLNQSSNSLVTSSNLIKKVYFPRLAIPLATVLSDAVDLILGFSVLVLLMAYYRVAPTYNIVWLPFFVLLAFATSLGVGLWLSAMNVKYRDVRYVVPFLVQFWLFATPIAYGAEESLSHYFTPHIGVSADVDVMKSSRDWFDAYGFRGGPTARFSKIGRLQPFARGLFGYGRYKATYTGPGPSHPYIGGFSFLAGGGSDVRLTGPFAARIAADYERYPSAPTSPTQLLRLSVGLVWRLTAY
jgi:lipopolysaccharide transport system permease protein